jgi:hypothetical protein
MKIIVLIILGSVSPKVIEMFHIVDEPQFQWSIWLGRNKKIFSVCSLALTVRDIYYFPDTYMYRILNVYCSIQWKENMIYMCYKSDRMIPIGTYADILGGRFLGRIYKHICMCNGADWESAARDGQIVYDLFTSSI